MSNPSALEFVSTNNFDKPDDQGHTSEYFTARNEAGQIIAQIIRSDQPTTPSVFYGYRMLKPGVSGKSQSKHLRRFGPFNSFDEARKAVEDNGWPGCNPNIPRNCNYCGEMLLMENLYVDDGCPCNSARGVNFKPQPCELCKLDCCVKPGHRLYELFGVAE